MPIRVIDHIEQVAADDWNRLNPGDNPFVRHEFLQALERSGCVQAKTGWHPQHILLEQDGELVAAAPAYLKSHSYGEYVFDWAWADAYQRAGLNYYPKLVAAVPFSPVTGPRILTTTLTPSIATSMADAARTLARKTGASSMHWLFTDEQTTQALCDNGYLQRSGFQYHWSNAGYESFDQFLGDFSSDKRKKVRRERRLVREQGVRMEVVEGAKLTEPLWNRFYEFYKSTILNHGAITYLNLEFFLDIGRQLADTIVMVLAWQGEQCIAAALNLKSNDALFGRYWGSDRHVDHLHFETCYYSAIEYCIDNGLARFEAGAQGGHKLSRGFLPTPTFSAHWLQHAEFSDAVERYLQQEQNGVDDQIQELNERAPFKRRC